MHLLPVAISVGVASVLGTKLAVRFGTKLVVAAGLLAGGRVLRLGLDRVGDAPATRRSPRRWSLSASAWGSQARPRPRRSWASCPAAKAGVGSAVNDATRLLGGDARRRGHRQRVRLAVSQAGSTSTLPARLPHGLASIAHSSAGAAFAVSGRLAATGHASLAGHVHEAAAEALVHGLSAGCLVAAAVVPPAP